MLHWSQEASTGWTRNSWGGSMAKRGRAFPVRSWLGRRRRIGGDRRPESTIRARRPAKAPRRRARALAVRVDAGPGRSYIAPRSAPPPIKELDPTDAGSVTASEFAFLALGATLGLVTGAALIEVLRGRSHAPHEVRVTVTADAIPRRRAVDAVRRRLRRGRQPARPRRPGRPPDPGAADARLRAGSSNGCSLRSAAGDPALGPVARDRRDLDASASAASSTAPNDGPGVGIPVG